MIHNLSLSTSNPKLMLCMGVLVNVMTGLNHFSLLEQLLTTLISGLCWFTYGVIRDHIRLKKEFAMTRQKKRKPGRKKIASNPKVIKVNQAL